MIGFNVARAWHEIYALRLQLFIDGVGDCRRDADAVRDDTACELGKWIHVAAVHQLGDTPRYRTLREVHRRFHECAGDMVGTFNTGNTDAARRIAASEFIAASAAVLAALDDVESDYRALHPPAPAFVVPPRAAAGRSGLAWFSDRQPWKESLRIGLPVIDEQHRVLTELVDKLMAMPAAKVNSERASDVFSKIGRLLESHFETEESLMKHHGVPADWFEAHRQEHTRILSECADIDLQVMAGRILTVTDIFPLLREMIIDHGVQYDLDIRKYLPPKAAS
jgi:hemerythrin-like metal-binding protein